MAYTFNVIMEITEEKKITQIKSCYRANFVGMYPSY